MSAMVIDGSFRARLLIRGPSGVSTTVTDGIAGAGRFGDSTTLSVKTGVALGALDGAVPSHTWASCAAEASAKPSRSASTAQPTRWRRIILNKSRRTFDYRDSTPVLSDVVDEIFTGIVGRGWERTASVLAE